MIYSCFEGRYWVEMCCSFVETLNFQAVIESAASAASRKPKSREGSSRERPGDGGRWDDRDGRTTDWD